MVALEAVCKHFGKEVHPESEWIYMQKEPSICTVCESCIKRDSTNSTYPSTQSPLINLQVEKEVLTEQDRDFFMHMQLSSGFSEPFPKARILWRRCNRSFPFQPMSTAAQLSRKLSGRPILRSFACVCAKAGVPEHGAKNLGFITSSSTANATALGLCSSSWNTWVLAPVFEGNKKLALISAVDTGIRTRLITVSSPW